MSLKSFSTATNLFSSPLLTFCNSLIWSKHDNGQYPESVVAETVVIVGSCVVANGGQLIGSWRFNSWIARRVEASTFMQGFSKKDADLKFKPDSKSYPTCCSEFLWNSIYWSFGVCCSKPPWSVINLLVCKLRNDKLGNGFKLSAEISIKFMLVHMNTTKSGKNFSIPNGIQSMSVWLWAYKHLTSALIFPLSWVPVTSVKVLSSSELVNLGQQVYSWPTGKPQFATRKLQSKITHRDDATINKIKKKSLNFL